MLEILGSDYQTKDKGQHIAPIVDAKIKKKVLQKSSQKNNFCTDTILSQDDNIQDTINIPIDEENVLF